ncbi:MAG: HlyC/CorC family transporter [Armatimonadetes bacterium]|nr:HlyC/CorC family transporter [Armatimonadota bacterium]
MESATLSIVLQVSAVAVCLVAIGFFSVCEAALVATNKIRLRALAEEEETDESDLAAAHHVSGESQRYLASVIVGINIPVLLVSSIMTHLFKDTLHRSDLVEWVTLGMIVTILIFCEIAPKTYTVHNAERVSLHTARAARLVLGLIQPFANVVMFISTGIIRAMGGEPGPLHEGVTDSHLKKLVEIGEEEGVLDEPETRLLENIFEFRETVAREIMIPRPDIICLPHDCSLEEALNTVEATGFSRIPIFEETPDNIVGVVYFKDLVGVFEKKLEPEGTSPCPRDLAKPAVFVPETRKIDDLFRDLREQKAQLAVVIDEHGGTSGLVTIEDILEEIVGEIVDEYDREERKVHPVSENVFMVDARIDVHDLQDDLGLRLPEGEFDTLAGFIYDRAGKIPAPGEIVETEEAQFIVQQIRRNRITRIKVIRKPS